MFGHPIALITKPFGMAGEVRAIAEGVAGSLPLRDRRKVENGKRYLRHGAGPILEKRSEEMGQAGANCKRHCYGWRRDRILRLPFCS